MFKDQRIVRKAANMIGKASEKVVADLLTINPSLTGREEEFTSQLKSQITLQLMETVRGDLDGKEIRGVRFQVYTFRKKEEKQVGADLLGLLETEVDGKILRKGYLAQAKVGRITNSTSIHPQARCKDPRLLGQVDKMLKLSNSAYVFIYTHSGIFVVPGSTVQQQNSNLINTVDSYYRMFGSFYEEFFKCFVGDPKLAQPYTNPEDLAKTAQRANANNALLVKATKWPPIY